MAMIGGIMVSHPPLIVPGVGRGQEILIKNTIRACQEAAGMAVQLEPDTIMMISSHAVAYADHFHVSPGKEAREDFGQFMVPQTGEETVYDEVFVRELDKPYEEDDFPMGAEEEREKELGHGALVPLHFIHQHYRGYKLVRIGEFGLPFAHHYRAGRCIAIAAENLGRGIFIVVNGNSSHELRGDGPYDYSIRGSEYGERIIDIMGKTEFGELLAFSENLCEKTGECDHHSSTMMAGTMGGKAVMSRRPIHEGPSGVDYGICTFRVIGDDDGRRFLGAYESCRKEACEKRRMKGDAYVPPVRRSLGYYVCEGGMIPFGRAEKEVPEEMLQTRAGVFVSIHRGSVPRGRIGAISPVRRNVAEEIIQSAMNAGTHGPRFLLVREEELPLLEYNVDMLGGIKRIQNEDQLDPLHYDVIVTRDRRWGLLLPSLEGVDTVEEQLFIARQKTGIRENGTDVELERFGVIRHRARS